MQGLNAVIALTVALAALCVLSSTWTTVGELHEIVNRAEAHQAQRSMHAAQGWRAVAERAVEHIEHLPHVPHGVHFAQYELKREGALPSLPSRGAAPVLCRPRGCAALDRVPPAQRRRRTLQRRRTSRS